MKGCPAVLVRFHSLGYKCPGDPRYNETNIESLLYETNKRAMPSLAYRDQKIEFWVIIRGYLCTCDIP